MDRSTNTHLAAHLEGAAPAGRGESHEAQHEDEAARREAASEAEQAEQHRDSFGSIHADPSGSIEEKRSIQQVRGNLIVMLFFCCFLSLLGFCLVFDRVR